MALAGRPSVRVHPVVRAPPPRLLARCTPRVWPGASMPSRMGGWSGVRSARLAQRCRRAVLVQVRVSLVNPVGLGRCARRVGKAASLSLKGGKAGAGGEEELPAVRGGAGDRAWGGAEEPEAVA